MSDINEFARSVVRIPVSGPAPNNTLVYVRAQFPTENRPISGRVDRYRHFTVTLYQIAGFDQSRAHEYAQNTKISVTGWLNLARSVGPQEFAFAVDELWGMITPDGHVAIHGNIAAQADQFVTVHDFWLSAYILTQEPERDFTGPAIDWSFMKKELLSDPAGKAKHSLVSHPLGKDELDPALPPFHDPKAIPHCDP